MSKNRRFILAALSSLPLVGTFPVQAQAYPSRAIRFVVGQPPGGPSDIVARITADYISRSIGYPVIVENRPGAGSNIGTDIVAKSSPDGYTMGAATIQHVVNRFLFKSLPFDPDQDLAPVTLVATAPIVLVVSPELPVKTVGELIAHAKANPGKLNAASAGNGGTSHLTAELFKARTGTDIVHVPYKGTQPALTDLLAGRVQMMFDGVITSKPHIEAGRLRPLMVAGPASRLLPGVPSASDAGMAGFEATGWVDGILVPAKTPAPVIEAIYREFKGAVTNPKIRDQLLSMGLEPLANTPSEFAALLQSEAKKWGEIIRNANIHLE